MLKKVNRDLTVQIADLQYQLSRQWLPDEDKVQRCAEENLQHLTVMAEFENKCDEIEKSTSIDTNRTPLISPDDRNLVMQMRLENSKLREFVSTLEVQVEKQLSQSSSLVTSPRCLSPSVTSPAGEEKRSTAQDRQAKDYEATEANQSDPYATIEQLRQQIKVSSITHEPTIQQGLHACMITHKRLSFTSKLFAFRYQFPISNISDCFNTPYAFEGSSKSGAEGSKGEQISS